MVQFDTADRVLSRLDWLWWEVWTPETVPDPAVLARVVYAFTGEQASIAA